MSKKMKTDNTGRVNTLKGINFKKCDPTFRPTFGDFRWLIEACETDKEGFVNIEDFNPKNRLIDLSVKVDKQSDDLGEHKVMFLYIHPHKLGEKRTQDLMIAVFDYFEDKDGDWNVELCGVSNGALSGSKLRTMEDCPLKAIRKHVWNGMYGNLIGEDLRKLMADMLFPVMATRALGVQKEIKKMIKNDKK